MVLGKLHAGLADGVDAVDFLGAGVVDEVTVLRFAIGEHLQKNERAHFCVVNFRVVQRLIGVEHGLAIDTLAVFGVVLDFDREIAADGLDEDFVENVDVRVTALDVFFTRGERPFEVVGRRENVVALAAVVDIGDRAVGRDGPAEHAHVLDFLAYLEYSEKLLADASQLEELGVLVIVIELVELLEKFRVREKVVGRILFHFAEDEAVLRLLVAVKAENVLDVGLFLEADEDVVAEQEVVAHLLDVARDTVVLGPDALVAQYRELGASEDLEALLC